VSGFIKQGYNPPMNFQTTDRFSISDEVLSQEVNGETVLLDLEGESYFGLNEVGTRIWQLLQSKPTVVETLNTLSDEYDVDQEQLESDVDELLLKLSDAALISLQSD
jgi:hypothetical protein